MKFIHIADVHFDIPFRKLEAKGLAETRRLEQRTAFRRVIEYIKEKNIPYLFICGDLFETEYIRISTIEYINKQFETIPNTKIFIVPGNHDPYIKNSYYNTYNFAPNVKIFTDKLEKVEESEVNIYGYGFNDFYINAPNNEELIQREENKINILLTHCDLDGAKDNDIRYNPISRNTLKALKFDYIALGHIHKQMIDKEIVYPGSLISLGFDEHGKHGMIEGEINEETRELSLHFIPVDSKEFEERELNVNDIVSEEELIETINQIEFNSDRYYQIVLVGNRKIEIETLKILKHIEVTNVLKIKDKTSLEIDLGKISQQNNLKGLFIKNLLEKLKEEPDKKEVIEKAIEIGLAAF